MSLSVTILGSTGSIGVSALRVIKSLGDEFTVQGLSCYRNLALLEQQVREFHPKVAAIGSRDRLSSSACRDLGAKYPDTEFLEGDDAIVELARRDADILVSAIVGSAGLEPTMASVPHVRRIALANKETLVMAGDLFMERVRAHGVELLPVDSEHSAIFSLLANLERGDVRRIILTASGGSLRDHTDQEIARVTPEEALVHPTWEMGNKITIDSATLMNKGLEVIEAHHLFAVGYDDIEVVIHPESIIHSMVETADGAVYAHMSVTDMALPILNALLYPEKRRNDFGRLDLAKIGSLSFRGYDPKRSPAVALCYRAGRTGGTMPAVLNGANEVAVEAFLNHVVPFTGIVGIVEKTMDLHYTVTRPDMDDIRRADAWAREAALKLLRG
jgi:1-deoxy-D-xylulose-5-phosphate reductoisomerase